MPPTAAAAETAVVEAGDGVAPAVASRAVRRSSARTRACTSASRYGFAT